MKEGAPGGEYKKLGLLIGNIIEVFRLSMGDTNIIGSIEWATDNEQVIFWFSYMMIIWVNNIIFLNFIIA